MIRYLEHRQIDFSRWDQCVSQAVNYRVNALSWYLEIVSPGWDALVEEDYVSVFPLTWNRKFGITYLYQPYFTQQLGIFSTGLLTEKLVEDFIQSIPKKFALIQIQLNSLNKIDPDRFPVISRVNYELDLIHPYENLTRGYNQNAKRNLKKAFDGQLMISRRSEPDELIKLFAENFGKKEGKLKYRHYAMLQRLMHHCVRHTSSHIISVYGPGDKIVAGVFLLQSKDRIIFHFAASDSRARENGAMFLLADSVIRENAGKPAIFDFEGSDDPNVARFYQGFGAKPSTYPMITLDRMPAILSRTVKFARKIR